MERAAIANRISDLKYIKPKYTRIYFGNEFCPWLLPNIRELKRGVEIIQRTKRKFTLLTPYADSEGLEVIKKIVEFLSGRKILKEVVVNDLGVLHYIRREFPLCSVIVGRLLSRTIGMEGNFLKKIGINRIEVDYFNKNFWGHNMNIFLRKISLSFYSPYIVIQGTRYCPVAGLGRNRDLNHGIIRCSKECLKIGELKVKNDLFVKKIILRGNAQFVKNSDSFLLASNIKNINRLVFQSRPPV